MTELLLVRHGETEWNAGEIFRGRADIGLNERGILQAKLLADYLADTELEAVYSSPLARAGRTAAGIAANHSLKINVEPGLVDFDYGEWQGMPLTEVRTIYENLYIKWEKSPETVKMPGGESLADVRERAVRCVETISARHSGTVVLVSHRVVNKVLVCALLGLDDSHFWNIRVDTCGITSFSVTGGQYILTGHNDTSFLRNCTGGPGDF
jgi:broad specificity phosphatase PhoE